MYRVKSIAPSDYTVGGMLLSLPLPLPGTDYTVGGMLLSLSPSPRDRLQCGRIVAIARSLPLPGTDYSVGGLLLLLSLPLTRTDYSVGGLFLSARLTPAVMRGEVRMRRAGERIRIICCPLI